MDFTTDTFQEGYETLLAAAAGGAADMGEVLATAARVQDGDPDSWLREWTATGGAAWAAANRGPSARRYLHAATYYAAPLALIADTDGSVSEAALWRRQRTCWERAVELLGGTRLAIPYEHTTLPGYFFRAGDAGDDTPRPTVILTNGYDGTVEELYFANAVAALERGYHVLAFDGPGQGSVILDQGIPFRPDWENVVSPVVDVAVARPEVDAERLVLIGWSFGGYTAPRAAGGEHRLAACVADSGPYDLYDTVIARMPGVLAHQLPDGNRLMLSVLEKALESTMKKPSAGWALRRNLWVHGVEDPMAYVELARQYSMKGREHLVRCPTFVCRTAGDDISAGAQELADHLTCPTEFVEFGHDDDVTGHCEMTGRAVFHQRLYRWLDGVLAGG
jgi:pimeloyl-ACP methyl ester carboxylesterase